MTTALYAGSFDPITNGHLDVLDAASKMFDKVIIAVAFNSEKQGFIPADKRVQIIKEAVKSYNNVEVDSYTGLTVKYAKEHGATHLIRGLRAVTDFEYEYQLASANALADNEIDMVFFMSRGETSNLTSSTIMELAKNGVDVSKLVPSSVLKRIK